MKKYNKKDIITKIYFIQGRRPYMEDYYYYYKNDNVIISSIFDGHGGKKCACFLKKNFYNYFLKSTNIYKTRKRINIKKAFCSTYNNLHKSFIKTGETSGSTCNTLFININTSNYFVANTGDSRIIACYNNGKIKQISKDHSVNNYNEQKKVRKRGGFIEDNRVNGILAMTRSIGDARLSKYLDSTPDIYTGSIQNISYFVQASDGLYDVLNNKNICSYINLLLKKRVKKKDIPKLLIKKAYQLRSMDNITVMITFIKS